MTFDSMWDERFATDEYAYGTEPNDFLRENVGKLKQGSVLSLAEGEGRNAVFLAKLGYEVTAIDGSIEGIKKAKHLAKQHNVDIDFIHADLCQFNLGESCWDNIVSIFAPFTTIERAQIHQQVIKALKPNGIYLLEAYNPKQIEFATGGGTDPSTMPSAKELSIELAGLSMNTLMEKNRFIQEGHFHKGQSAVTQLIGVKVKSK